MAKRKGPTLNPPTDAGAGDVRAFAVVLEGVRSDFRVFGEALGGFRDETLQRFGQQETRFDRIDRDIGLVKVAVTEIRRELKKKVDRDEVVAIVEEVIERRG